MTHAAINLNADLGESYGAWTMGDDQAMLNIVGSANVACGFHAGDPLSLIRTLRLAAQRGVSVGAHPSYPDLQGFGRRPMRLSDDELHAALIYQIGALQALAQTAGTRVSHVKPHGALHNLAAADAATARVVARAIADVDAHLILLAPAASVLAAVGQDAGLRVALEIFADRNYQADGQLLARQLAHALVGTPAQCAQHAMNMLKAGGIVSVNGSVLPTAIHSVCVHGDGPEAVASAAAVRAALVQEGYRLAPLTDLV